MAVGPNYPCVLIVIPKHSQRNDLPHCTHVVLCFLHSLTRACHTHVPSCHRLHLRDYIHSRRLNPSQPPLQITPHRFSTAHLIGTDNHARTGLPLNRNLHKLSVTHMQNSPRCGCLLDDCGGQIGARSSLDVAPEVFTAITQVQPALCPKLHSFPFLETFTHTPQRPTPPDRCPQRNCTEKQPQMVLLPSSRCHKLNRASPRPSERPVLLIWLPV